jgi:hypothetical protein
MNAKLLTGCVIAALSLPASFARAELPAAIAAPGETPVTTIHAEGAQIYECKAGASGVLVWQFREPIATLSSMARQWAAISQVRAGS